MRHRTASIGFLLSVGVTGLQAQALDSARVAAAAAQVVSNVAATVQEAPGCAVGVSLAGKPVYLGAFGLAELEYRIPNTPETIFESGSVAKQFTAASLVLLAREGKLSIDDPVRKYIPELPDYGAPLTIRHILNHTAGLRDWGAVMGMTGVGRGQRIVSQALALDVIVHQRALDFAPGAEYSYSNSGYTLAAEIVERVSKQSFSQFAEERLFQPLGMAHSSWRTDYRRLVPGRAQAYSRQGSGPWQLNMPFMNVYGNGGMLTTVGDWLRWNAMLDSRSLGADLVEALETQGRLNDGRTITYALGLNVGESRGQRHVWHGGSTAGYTTVLDRWPGLGVSVAVLCNGPAVNPSGLARGIMERLIPEPAGIRQPDTVVLTEEQRNGLLSLWRDTRTHFPMRIVQPNGTLRIEGGPPLRPLTDGTFQLGTGSARLSITRAADGSPATARVIAGDGISDYEIERPWTPTGGDLQQFAGSWNSEESGATFTLEAENGGLIFTQRPATRIPLRPVYRDHFMLGNGGVLWFTRNAAGAPETLHAGTGRMRDMLFARATRR